MISYLAQAIDEAIPEGATGMAAAEAVADFMEKSGFRIVPKEPTPEMIAATLPLTGQHRDPLAERTAEQALFILDRRPKEKFMPDDHRKGKDAALYLIGDYRAMLYAARA